MAIINRIQFALTLIVAILLICGNSALKTTQHSVTLTLGHEEADPRLAQLAAAIDVKQLKNEGKLHVSKH